MSTFKDLFDAGAIVEIPVEDREHKTVEEIQIEISEAQRMPRQAKYLRMLGRRHIVIANPEDKGVWQHTYVLWFGCIGTAFVLVYAHHLSDALEEAAAKLKDLGWDGYFDEPDPETTDCEHCKPYPCTCDLTYTESGHIPSHEWGIALEDPDRSKLIEFHYGDNPLPKRLRS